MNSIFKTITFFSLMSIVYCGRAMEPNEKSSEPRIIFEQAVRMADHTGDVDALHKCVNELPNLNTFMPFGATYPLQYLLHEPYGSDLVITAIERGARPDLTDLSGTTMFTHIVYSIDRKLRSKRKSNIFFSPYQNLLSVLALPTYCCDDAHEDTKVLTDEDRKDKALRAPCSVVLTFLLCLKRLDAPCSCLKQVKPCILKYLIDASCSQKIFNETLRFMDDPDQLIMRFPFKRFANLAQAKDNPNDREKFAAEYAPLFARYRLTQAVEILQTKNNEGHNAYEEARREIPIFMNQGDIRQATHLCIMALCLNPEGFVERHMGECTRIIKNKLLGRDPFDGFDEFKNNSSQK